VSAPNVITNLSVYGDTANTLSKIQFSITESSASDYVRTLGMWDMNGLDIIDDLTISKRLLTAKSDTAFITTDSVITVSNGNFAVVSDSATIGRLYYMTTTGWTVGSMLTLYFTGAVAVGHAEEYAPANTIPFYLKLAEDFTIADTDILTVIYDGTYWREISRTDNTP